MDDYELIRNLLRLAPLIIVIIANFYFFKLRPLFHAAAMFLFGWVVIILAVELLVSYSVHYAPTEELFNRATTSDGGARVGSLIFGWFYSLILFVIAEIVRRLVLRVKRLNKNSG